VPPEPHGQPKIFVSYRRDGTIGHAGRRFDRLAQEFGRAAANEDQVRLLP